MPSILDIAPPELSAKEVEIRGVKFMLSGIAAIDWAVLYSRFPILRKVATGNADESDDLPPLAATAMNAAIIAAGVGQLGNPDIERAAALNLSREEILELVAEVFRLSAPGQMLSPLLDGEPFSSAPLPNNGAGAPSVVPDTNSPKPLSH